MSAKPVATQHSLEDSMQRARRDVSLARHVPFGAHVAPGVIKLRQNGDLCSTWRVAGLPFVTTAPVDILANKQQLLNFVHSMSSTELAEPTALWVHRVRRKTTDRLTGQFDNDFAETVDRKYWEHMNQTVLLRSELYVTLVLRPGKTAAGFFRKMSARKLDDRLQYAREVLSRFEDLCQRAEAGLKKYGGERLVCEERVGINGAKRVVSPTLSFFSWLLGGVEEEIALQPSPINTYLSPARLFTSDSAGIVELAHPTRKTYAGYLELQDYPEVTEPGLNNCLFGGDYEFVETQSYSFASKRDGVAALERQQKRMVSSGEASEEQIADLTQAVEDVRNGRIFMGEYHYSLGLRGKSIKEVRDNMAKARITLESEASYKVATSDLIPECAHLAQLPGNWRWRPRTANITTRNFVSLSPLHNFDAGKRDGNPWGQAITMFQTPSRQGYYLNFHEAPLGINLFGKEIPGDVYVTGKTGTGKSALVAFLLCQAQKIPGLRVMVFDKDRSNEIIVRRLGGRYRQLKRGHPTGWNPFRWPKTIETIEFVKSLLLAMAKRGGQDLSPANENKLDAAIDQVFELDEPHRRISAVLQFVGEDSELGQRLSKWCRTPRKVGANAWVFDNAVDTTDFEGGSIFGFDYSDCIDDPECGPFMLTYMLRAANTLIDGAPFVYLMEEFAKQISADSQELAEFARDACTTIRKKNGLGIFITQSPSQTKDHPVGVTLREQTTTQIYLPNPGLKIEDTSLPATEYSIVRNLDPHSRTFLVKQGDRSTVCTLDLGFMDEELLALSGSLERAKLLDAVRAELGNTDDPRLWWQPYVDACRGSVQRKALASRASASAS